MKIKAFDPAWSQDVGDYAFTEVFTID